MSVRAFLFAIEESDHGDTGGASIGRHADGRSARCEPAGTLPRRYLAGAVSPAPRRSRPSITCRESGFGPYWSVSTYKPIVQVESLPELYSSQAGGITIADFIENSPSDVRMPMFIAMDRPKHTGQRRTVAPAFTPSEMVRLSDNIRAPHRRDARSASPWGKEFDWVDTVSIELTTQMLAILFDFPWEDRRKLTFWSDWAGDIELVQDRGTAARAARSTCTRCGGYFQNLWDQKRRQGADPRSHLDDDPLGRDGRDGPDGVPRQSHPADRRRQRHDAQFDERGSPTASTCSPSSAPGWRAIPSLIHNAVQEIIRWQTPLAHMRRTATEDTELEGQQDPRRATSSSLWYISANRDESVFENADKHRSSTAPNARRHLAFGHGIHRCVGARLAELQIAILLEEMAKRRMRVNVVGEPDRVAACFVHGYRKLPVEITKY